MECLHLASPLPVQPSARLIVGLPQLVLSLLSFVLNLTILILLIKRRQLLNSNFRAHIISQTLASLGLVTVAVVIFTPVVLFSLNVPDLINIILATPDSLFYQATMFISTAIAIERCTMFVSPKIHDLFDKGHIFFLVLPWISAFSIVSHSTSIGCYKRVDPFGLRYTYACSHCGAYDTFLYYASFVFPSSMCFSYLILFSFLYIRNAKSRLINTSLVSQRQQFSFAVQFSTLALLQLFASIFFYVLPVLFGNSDIVNSILTSATTANSLANPICLLAFQKSVRDSLLRNIPLRSSKEPFSIVDRSRISTQVTTATITYM